MDLSRFQDIWNTIYHDLSKNYPQDTFEDVFEDVKSVIKYNNGLISILVPNLYTQKKINNLYIYKIDELLRNITPEQLKFKFVTKEEIVEQIPYEKVNEFSNNHFETNLNRNYTFDSFVVGNSNRLSFQMSMRVADQPGTVGNPLYIFGDVGLGKTHLMHAVGNYMIEKDINKRILYVTASEFVRDYQRAASSQNMKDFDDKYGNIDALLVDDIQMLSSAKKTQTQFFHVFEQLYNKNKQIIITSDSPAEKLVDIMPRLQTRFDWGFLANIDSPDLSLRVNILKRKIAETTEDVFSNEVLEFIAKSFPKNVRSLEGALTRVLFHCVDSGLDVNIENTKEALAPLLSSKKESDSNEGYEKLLSIITDTFKISMSDLLSSKRSSKYVIPRHICMYLLKNEFGLTYKKIGNILGGRDHSTVMSGYNRIEDELKADEHLKESVNIVLSKFNKQSTEL